ncbi:conserved hypothetical protein [Methanohalobium evestigatum Z-7303]|uniref:Uncharacterized protein n=2 Tax=Methanohalobium evestigatum TaxID=2322 RepID=D7E9S0_METEZ|nr:conserved hypothetical protein [Methanohalobium evestigatum Z-7303]
MSYLKKILAIFIVFLVLITIVNLAPLALMTVEPLYIIENNDKYPHNATVKVTGNGGEYSENTTYHLEPEESVSVEKPITLLIKWSNPFKKGYQYYASGDYRYHVIFENTSVTYYSTPHLVNTVKFKLINENGNFYVHVSEYS